MRFTFKLVYMIWFALLLTFSSSVLSQGAQIQGPRDSAGVYSGVVYGPIDPNDTLWGIASRYKQGQQFSVYQVMMAIYELNRNAFENGNFNTMVNGSMLQLPSDRYIARVDPQRAKAKAERDDRAFGRTPATSNTQAQAAVPPAANLKPEIPLVNKEDLSATEQQLQRQLNGLRSQQNRLFDEIKNQMETSISNTQAIVDNNKQLLARLDQNEQEFLQFRSTLESDFQSRLDAQSAQIEALTDLVKDAQARELEKEANSLTATLLQPAVLIGSTAFLSLLLLGGVAVWLLKKPKAATQSETLTPNKKAASEDIIDDELIIGEADDLQDDDTDELLAALESDVDDESLLDDILSEELEDSIDEVPIEGDDFDEISDEMLVPDQAPADDNAESIDLDDDDENSDQIDLSDDGLSDALDKTDDLGLDDLGEDLSEQDSALSKAVVDNLLDEEDEESEADEILQSSNNGIPEGIALDEDGQIDEDTLNQIEASIVEKDEELNEITEEISEGLANEQASDEALSQDDLDSLLDEASEPEIATEAEAEVQPEPESAGDDDLESDDTIDLTSETEVGKTEASESTATIQEEESTQADGSNASADDIDAILEQSGDLDTQAQKSEPEPEQEPTPVQDELESKEQEKNSSEEEPVTNEDDLSEVEDDVTDLTAQGVDSDDEVKDESSDEPDDDIEISEEIISIETDDEIEIEDDASSMAEELLAELEASAEEENAEDELDALLQEMDVDEELVVDEMMAEIPSLAEEMSAMSFDSDASDEQNMKASEESEEDDSLELDESVETDEPVELDEPVNEPSEEAVGQTVNESVETSADDEPDIPIDEDLDLSLPTEQRVPTVDDIQNSESELADESGDESAEENVQAETSPIDSKDAEVVSDPFEALEQDDFESDEDVLSELPDLDGWLDEDENNQPTESSAKSEDPNELSSEIDESISADDIDDELLKEIEDADFDSLLEEVESISEEESETLDNPDLDLTALLDESSDELSDEPSDELNEQDKFVDVDDLLSESESAPQLKDEDLELKLNMDIPSMGGDDASGGEGGNESNNISEEDTNQASNLDLAQVYIDMGDHDAAIETLQEVLDKGDAAQRIEAKGLLESIG